MRKPMMFFPNSAGAVLMFAAHLALVGCAVDATGGAKPPASRSAGWSREGDAFKAGGGAGVQRGAYHGWTDAVCVNNGKVAAVVVPSVGRVMQFKFAGEDTGPFWENAALAGMHGDARGREWQNIGGDKSWPAPEGEWPRVAGRKWHPPVAFDSLPCSVCIDGKVVMLVSPVDRDYGIRVRRRIELAANQPVMRITTTYEKISGPRRRVGIWVISQFKDPVAVFVPVPADSPFSSGQRGRERSIGYEIRGGEEPPSLAHRDGLISLTRDPKKSHKIGNDADRLVWIGKSWAAKVESARVHGVEYPDHGRSAEVYTNPNPLEYVELELLGPLRTLKPGGKISRTVTYTLAHRTKSDPAAEARRILAN